MVAERGQEIGIRMALGADRSRVLAGASGHYQGGSTAYHCRRACWDRKRLPLESPDCFATFWCRAYRRYDIRNGYSDDRIDSRYRMFLAGMARIAAGPERGAQIGVDL